VGGDVHAGGGDGDEYIPGRWGYTVSLVYGVNGIVYTPGSIYYDWWRRLSINQSWEDYTPSYEYEAPDLAFDDYDFDYAFDFDLEGFGVTVDGRAWDVPGTAGYTSVTVDRNNTNVSEDSVVSTSWWTNSTKTSDQPSSTSRKRRAPNGRLS
jgi:hypothetical protein